MQQRWKRHTRPSTSSTSDRRTEWRAALKEKDRRQSALVAKFENFSHEPKHGGNKRKKTTKKECNYCKKGWQVVPRAR